MYLVQVNLLKNDLTLVDKLAAREGERTKRIKKQCFLQLQRNKGLRREIFVLERKQKEMLSIDYRMDAVLLALIEKYFSFIQNLLVWEPSQHEFIVDFSPNHFIKDLRGLLFLKDEERAMTRKYEDIFALEQDGQTNDVLISSALAAVDDVRSTTNSESGSFVIRENDLVRIAGLLSSIKNPDNQVFTLEMDIPTKQGVRDSLYTAFQRSNKIILNAETYCLRSFYSCWKRRSSVCTQTTDSYLMIIKLSENSLDGPNQPFRRPKHSLRPTQQPIITGLDFWTGSRKNFLRKLVPAILVPFVLVLPFEYTPEVLQIAVVDQMITLFINSMFTFRFASASKLNAAETGFCDISTFEKEDCSDSIGYYLHQCALHYLLRPGICQLSFARFCYVCPTLTRRILRSFFSVELFDCLERDSTDCSILVDQHLYPVAITVSA